jgi:hypothetical protein
LRVLSQLPQSSQDGGLDERDFSEQSTLEVKNSFSYRALGAVTGVLESTDVACDISLLGKESVIVYPFVTNSVLVSRDPSYLGGNIIGTSLGCEVSRPPSTEVSGGRSSNLGTSLGCEVSLPPSTEGSGGRSSGLGTSLGCEVSRPPSTEVSGGRSSNLGTSLGCEVSLPPSTGVSGGRSSGLGTSLGCEVSLPPSTGVSGGEKLSIGTSLGCEGSLSLSTGVSGGEKLRIENSQECEGSLSLSTGVLREKRSVVGSSLGRVVSLPLKTGGSEVRYTHDVTASGVDECIDPDVPWNSAFNLSLKSAMQLSAALFPEEDNSLIFTAMIAVVKEADLQMSKVYTAKDAAAWGGDFKIPPWEVAKSVSLLKSAGGDLDVMVNRQKQLIGHDRLSVERIEKHINVSNPEREKLLLLARVGMPVMPDPEFVPNSCGELPKLRKLYLEVAPAVNKMVYENFVEKGLAFVFPKKVLLDWVPGVHLNPLGWTDNEGKVEGRNIGDCADGGKEPGNSPLNSEHTKDESDLLWGKIVHPTLADIVQMILRFFRMAQEKDPKVQWEDIVIWKMDLKGAYTLLFFKTEDVRLLCSEMTDDQIMVFICGIFGWTGTPMAFQVITRAILWELALILAGLALMFVDDIIGVCLLKDLPQELAKTRLVCTNLLGSLSVADKKTAYARRLTVIGYDIDLDKSLATVSRKNLLRCIHGFCL